MENDLDLAMELEIDTVMNKIRSYVRKADIIGTVFDETVWPQLLSALDTIEDAQCAIDYYCTAEFPSERDSYLFIYGLFQAFFLQQDAINALHHIVKYQTLNISDNLKELNELLTESNSFSLKAIREIRDDLTGHPTNRGNKKKGKKFIRLVRMWIRKESLTYFISGENVEEREKKIDVGEIIFEQKILILKILIRIEEMIITLVSKNKERK